MYLEASKRVYDRPLKLGSICEPQKHQYILQKPLQFCCSPSICSLRNIVPIWIQAASGGEWNPPCEGVPRRQKRITTGHGKETDARMAHKLTNGSWMVPQWFDEARDVSGRWVCFHTCWVSPTLMRSSDFGFLEAWSSFLINRYRPMTSNPLSCTRSLLGQWFGWLPYIQVARQTVVE